MGITGCLRQSLPLSLLFFGIQSSATSRMKSKFTLQPTKFPGHIHFELQLPLAMVWVNEEAHKVLFVWERWEIEKNYFSNFSLTSKKEKKNPIILLKKTKEQRIVSQSHVHMWYGHVYGLTIWNSSKLIGIISFPAIVPYFMQSILISLL